MYTKSNSRLVSEGRTSSKQSPPVRAFGQRSIPSIFRIRSSKLQSSGNSTGDENIRDTNNRRPVSLSDFLNKNLHKGSVLPTSARDKNVAALSAADDEPRNSPIGEKSAIPKTREGVDTSLNLDLVLKQFKCNKQEKENSFNSGPDIETGTSVANDAQLSNKRKLPFAGPEKSSRKHLVIIGDDDPNSISAKYRNNHRRKEMVENDNKPIHLFNHYANGRGWWDSDMAGVDHEEVGCNEAWEGVGSTTIGGLDWH